MSQFPRNFPQFSAIFRSWFRPPPPPTAIPPSPYAEHPHPSQWYLQDNISDFPSCTTEQYNMSQTTFEIESEASRMCHQQTSSNSQNFAVLTF